MSSNVQAVLFERASWTPRRAEYWLHDHGVGFVSKRVTGKYYRYRVIEPNYAKYEYRILRMPDHDMAMIIQYKK